MDRANGIAGGELLARWDAHRLVARREAIITGRPVAGAGLDVVDGSEEPSALIITLEPQRVPLLNADILPTSA